MHAQAASISGKTQMALAMNNARQKNEQMRKIHGDKSYSIRDVVMGMLAKAPDQRTITIHPGIASRILTEANFPDQRKITEDRLYAAKHSITNGTWNPYHTIHFVLLADGAFWLVNGQTRMTAIAETGMPQKVGVVVQPVADEHEAREIYTQFDKAAGIRTSQQLLNAAGIARDLDLPKQLTNYLYSAMGIIANDMQIPKGSSIDEKSVAARNMENRMAAIGEWKTEAHVYAAAIEDAGKDVRRQLMRAGTLAVALVTFRYQPERAAEFWVRVADGANLKKNDPRLTLARDLPSRNTGIGISNHSIQQAALAWNAYMENRELKIIKCIPEWRMYIAGTPFGKGKK